MKHRLTKLKNGKAFLILGMAIILLCIGSCKPGGGEDDPQIDPKDTSKVVTYEMYIILNGKKVVCKIPATTYETYYNAGARDTAVKWEGNIPVGAGGDTSLYIGHKGPRISGFKYKIRNGISADAVYMDIRWGIISGQPELNIDGGDYTLEKIKGKWVSTLKNGTGYDVNVSGKKYTGIEFRMIWP